MVFRSRDRVTRIKNSHLSITLGNSYTVHQVDSDGNLYIRGDDGKFCWCRPSFFIKENNMNLSNSIKSYIEKNQDTFFTIAIVILLDHYLFEGALRSKIKTSVEGMIDALPGGRGE